MAAGAAFVEGNGGRRKGIVAEAAVGFVFGAGVFGGFEVALGEPLLSVD